MKFIILVLFSLLSLSSFGDDGANYHILEGRLHKGGTARIEISKSLEGIFVVKMEYHLLKKKFVPIPKDALAGSTFLQLPEEFRDERGYLDLEAFGTMDIPDAKLKFLRRIDYDGLKDAYLILVSPLNGKSEIEIIYHPTLPSVGFAKLTITFISSIPILNGYKIQTLLD